MTLDFTPAAAGEENLEYLEFLNLESSGHLILAQKLGCTFALYSSGGGSAVTSFAKVSAAAAASASDRGSAGS